MPSDPGILRIRNQRYPLWVAIAEGVFGVGMGVAFLVIENVGLWLFDVRTAMYALLVAFLAILPIAVYGGLEIWDLRRPGPGEGLSGRALLRGVFLGLRDKEFAKKVEWTALTGLRSLLPSVYTVFQLKLGEELQAMNFRFPVGALKRVRFAPDPDEDFNEFERISRLCQATVEIHSGRQFQLIVDEADAERLRQWAIGKAITVCNAEDLHPQEAEPARHA